jgi:hypothetical protein
MFVVPFPYIGFLTSISYITLNGKIIMIDGFEKT